MNGCFWSSCSADENGVYNHAACDSDEKCGCVSGEGDDECTTDNDCLPAAKPSASGLATVASNYCTGIQGKGLAYFQWHYSDPNSNIETQYEIQIDDNYDFSSPEVDRISYFNNATSGSLQQQLVLVEQSETTENGDYILYNTQYYWKVRVKNSNGVWSEWANYNDSNYSDDNDGDPDTYTYPYAHPSPVPAYSYSPTNPVPENAVTFDLNSSICYDTTQSISCSSLDKCSTGNCYTLDFGDSGANSGDQTINPSVVSYTKGNIPDSVEHTYTQFNTFHSSLGICDDIGCCYTPKDVPVTASGSKGLPQWKEVSPF